VITGNKRRRGQFGQSLGSWVFDLDNFFIPQGFYGVFDVFCLVWAGL
jgi:hypothetical protein